jgi:WD40-like Beta Propeller Repeat
MSPRALLLISSLAAPVGCGAVEQMPAGLPPGQCDPLAPFDPPQPMAGAVATGSADAALSADELTLYMTRDSAAGDRDLYVASRSKIDQPFGMPMALMAVNSPSDDAVATLPAAGITLMFQSARVAGEGKHLYVATRSSPLAEFGAPALFAGVRSPVATDDDLEPFATADGKELWFISNRGGNQDVFRAVKASDGFSNPAPVAELNSPSVEQHVMVSADRRTVYFASNRAAPGALGGFEIFRAHRNSVSDGFGAPVLVPELNTVNDDSPRWLSADSCRIYLHVKVGSGYTLLVATRHPAS